MFHAISPALALFAGLGIVRASADIPPECNPPSSDVSQLLSLEGPVSFRGEGLDAGWIDLSRRDADAEAAVEFAFVGTVRFEDWVAYDRIFDLGPSGSLNIRLHMNVASSNLSMSEEGKTWSKHDLRFATGTFDMLNAHDFLSKGESVHVAAIIAADGTKTLYRNGVEVARTAGAPLSPGRRHAFVGKSHWCMRHGRSCEPDSNLDTFDLRFFDYALTPECVRALYDAAAEDAAEAIAEKLESPAPDAEMALEASAGRCSCARQVPGTGADTDNESLCQDTRYVRHGRFCEAATTKDACLANQGSGSCSWCQPALCRWEPQEEEAEETGEAVLEEAVSPEAEDKADEKPEDEAGGDAEDENLIGSVGPAWTYDPSVERPEGEKDMGGWTAAVYTEEQQVRLGVDENGNPISLVVAMESAPTRHASEESVVGVRLLKFLRLIVVGTAAGAGFAIVRHLVQHCRGAKVSNGEEQDAPSEKKAELSVPTAVVVRSADCFRVDTVGVPVDENETVLQAKLEQGGVQDQI
jgi:hypothetical protein